MSIVGSEIKKLSLMKAYQFLDRDPEQNLPKLVEWFDTFVPENILQVQRKLFRDIVTKKDTNWYKLLVSLWTDMDDEVRKTLFENLVINANALAAQRAQESRLMHDCNIPWAISIGIDDDEAGGSLNFDQWDDVIEQAKDLGTFMFIFQGGEPLDFKEEIIALCNKHYDCEFMIFTDGDKIDEEFCNQVLRVKNLIVTVRIRGTKRDARIDEAVDMMRRAKIPYSCYCFYNRENQEHFAKEEFFDGLINKGFKLALFFSSIPDDEDKVYDKTVEYRKSKPIVTINFCKDKEITGGCVAGGRYYCNIDAKGNVAPCFFVKESERNLKESSLLDALKSPLFMKYHDSEVPCDAEK